MAFRTASPQEGALAALPTRDELAGAQSSEPAGARTSLVEPLAPERGADDRGELSTQEAPAAASALASERPAGWLPRVARGLSDSLEWLFGCVSLVTLLAIVSVLPGLQWLSLGYLLEVSGRVSQGGRLRDGLVGVRHAARVGGILLGLWLLSFPLRFVAVMWFAAALIDPRSAATIGWRLAFYLLALAIAVHAAGALLRGGRLRCFLWPRPIHTLRLLYRGGSLARARDGLWEFAAGMRLPYYFVRGAKGFCGAIVWLAIPTALFAAGPGLPRAGGWIVALGAGLMFWATLRLPLLEAAFAAENRWAAMFEPGRCRRMFGRAPLAFALAIFATLALSLPLLLLKIEMIPREAAWLPSLLFVVTGLPARLAMGWAWGRAARRETPRHWLWRIVGRLVVIPACAFYVLIIYISRFSSWHGVWSLCEQHAFLVPAPFLDF